ncbi:translation elongation factor G, partial [mine drainage metagenome]
MPITPRDIRNIALAGHPGAGKTTLFEALLLAGGVIQTAGTIERGSTLGDFDAEEIARGHSIQSALATIERPGLRVNLIDTPGYPDFRGPTLAALTAVETVAIVVSAAAGIEYGTRRLMHYARSRGLARVLVINRIDAEDADLAALVDALRAEFGPECLPVNLPARGRATVLDAFSHASGDTDFDSLAGAHARILDQVVEINERMMGRYLDAGEDALSAQDLHDAFEQCLREGHLLPICFTSARSGAGVAEFIELAQRLLPSPAEANPPPYRRNSDGARIEVLPDPARHVLADVFKIQHDAFLGKIAVFRVHQGTLHRDAQCLSTMRASRSRSATCCACAARTRRRSAAIPGDIAAVAKVDDIHPEAVLHDSHDEDGIALAPIALPQPMFALAIEAASKGQEQKLALALARLAE